MSVELDGSVRHQVVVDLPQDRAFWAFTDLDRIKPREHNMLAVPIEATVLEQHAGGGIYDRGVDGSICRWGRVLTFDPPHSIVFSWDIGPDWQVATDLARTSEAEVTFNRRERHADHGHPDPQAPRPTRCGVGIDAGRRRRGGRLAAVPGPLRVPDSRAGQRVVSKPDLMVLAQEERTDLLALLEELSAEQWNAPSLCTEWRVRDVATHIVSYDELGDESGVHLRAWRSARRRGQRCRPGALPGSRACGHRRTLLASH